MLRGLRVASASLVEWNKLQAPCSGAESRPESSNFESFLFLAAASLLVPSLLSAGSMDQRGSLYNVANGMIAARAAYWCVPRSSQLITSLLHKQISPANSSPTNIDSRGYLTTLKAKTVSHIVGQAPGHGRSW